MNRTLQYRLEKLKPFNQYFGGPGSGRHPEGGGKDERTNGREVVANAKNVSYPKESMEPEDLESLVEATGIPNSFKGNITVTDHGSLGYQVELIDTKGINIDVFLTEGNETAELAMLYVPPAQQGEGTRIFKRMIDGMHGIGVNKITMDAKGSSAKGDFNGYYTWARLGVIPYKNEKLDKAVSDYNTKNNTSFKNLNELVKDKAGADYWKQNGFSWEGSFDLNKDSESRKIFNDYLKEKGKQ